MSFADLLASADGPVRTILGGTVTYSPGAGASVDVDGVFSASSVVVDLGQPGVSSVRPTAFLRLSDLPTDPETDLAARVTSGGVVYSINEVRPDGLGGVLLILQRVT